MHPRALRRGPWHATSVRNLLARGCARAGWCPTSRTLADELEFLIRTQWLTESEAANRRAVKCAIARVVTQN